MAQVSIVIPAYNEAGAVGETVERVREVFDASDHEYEVIVVNDGSRDETGREAREAGARVIRHPMNLGYGNGILSGVRQARFELIGLTDADGTYPIEELPGMADDVERRGLDMLVGARQGKQYQGRFTKRIARRMFKFLAEFATGESIADINSGLRIMRRDMVMKFAPIACGGFSFSTTMTVVALLTGHFVAHKRVPYHARKGASKVHYVRDTLRAGQILTMAILLFNPIKLFILLAAMVMAVGLFVILLVLATAHDVENIGLYILGVFSLFFVGASLLMGFGLVCEQRRADSRGRVMMSRELPVEEAGSEGDD